MFSIFAALIYLTFCVELFDLYLYLKLQQVIENIDESIKSKKMKRIYTQCDFLEFI